jgi:predicted permease
MSEIATVALPFFGLVFLGYGIGRWGPVKREFYEGFSFLVRYAALPAMYFRLLAAGPRSDVTAWSFILTTTFATYCAFAIAFSVAALINRGRVPEATIEGLAGAHSANAYLAPGLALAALGPAAGVPTALVVAFDGLMLTILTPLMMAMAATERMTAAGFVRSLGDDLLAQPFLIAAAVGFLYALTGLGLPGPADFLLTSLSGAAIPCALVAIGLALSERALKPPTVNVGVLVAIKLVGHPLIVWLLLSWIGGFDRTWVNAALLIAALPPGLELIAAARRYRSYVAGASLAVLWGSIASVVTLTIALILVLNDLLPLDPFR